MLMRFLFLSTIVTFGIIFSSRTTAATGPEFQFKKKNELSVLATFYNSDAMRTTTLGSASYTYHLNREWWIGGDFIGGKPSVDSGNGLGLSSKSRFWIFDSAIYWNLAALLGATLEDVQSAWPVDLYTSIGAGGMILGRHKEPFGFIGGGIIIPISQTPISVRVDLKNLFLVLKNTQGADFNSDMILSLGLSLFL